MSRRESQGRDETRRDEIYPRCIFGEKHHPLLLSVDHRANLWTAGGRVMNSDNGRRFGRRMIDTWPNGPKQYIWEEIARNLETHTARLALQDCEQNCDRITPAAFHRSYSAITARMRRAEQAAPTTCEQCDGTGWVDAPEQARENSSASKPCRCTKGQTEARRTQRRILDHNGTHLNPEHRTDPDSPTPLFPEDSTP